MPQRVEHEGYTYIENRKYQSTTYFRCVRYQADLCKARLIWDSNRCTVKGIHSCVSVSSKDVEQASIEDYIERRTTELPKEVLVYPEDAYAIMLRELRSKHPTAVFNLPSKSVFKNRLSYLRMNMEQDIYEQLRKPPLNLIAGGRKFHRRSWFGDVCRDDRDHCVLLWAPDELLSLLRYNGQVYIDATFRCVPPGFTQCCIIVAYDSATQTYVPCVYALMTGRSDYLYCVVIHEVICLTGYSWNPSIVVVDFEQALHKCIEHEFKDSAILGCFFHFKQCLKRKMSKYGIDASEMTTLLHEVDLLTLVQHKELPLAIQYLREKLQLFSCEWSRFWVYFEKTWQNRFPPKYWNVSEHHAHSIQGRTNNCIERYNRRLGEKFACPHPKLLQFVQVLRSKAEYYIDYLARCRNGQENIVFEDRTFILPTLPAAYKKFIKAQK
jgi:hypothetical protein